MINKEGGSPLDRVNHIDIGSNRSTPLAFPDTVAPKANQQSRRRIPNNTAAPMDIQPRRPIPKVQFRILIIGRANAGKTSILQRVCDTTKSPVIYWGNKKVRGPTFSSETLISLPIRLNFARQWRLVTRVHLFSCL